MADKYINGKKVEATEFFYDRCHKVYIADSQEGYSQMFRNGWDENDIFPIEELPEIWVSTCPLRFISSADLHMHYVGQCEPAEFVGWDIDDGLQFELDEIAREQMEANSAG